MMKPASPMSADSPDHADRVLRQLTTRNGADTHIRLLMKPGALAAGRFVTAELPEPVTVRSGESFSVEMVEAPVVAGEVIPDRPELGASDS